ncbi:Ig-like domain-containing protein [Pseudoalteromonas sp. GB56]
MRATLSALSISTLFALTGCSENENADEINKAFNEEEQVQTGDLIESVVVYGGNIRIEPGDTVQLTAIGKDLNGKSKDISSDVTWKSSHPDSAAIDENGLVTAIAKADTQYSLITFTATALGDASESAQISVKDIAIESITLSSSSAEVYACQPNTIASTIIFTDGYQGKVQNGDLTWSSLNDNQTRFSENGELFTRAEPGSTLTISASYEQAQSNRYQLEVAASQISSIEFVDADSNNLDSLTMELGSRSTIGVSGKLGSQVYDLTPIIVWDQKNEDLVHVATDPQAIGSIIATSKGTGLIYAQCTDTLNESLSVEVESSAEGSLESITVNDGIEALTVNSGATQKLTVFANYQGLNSAINVSDATDVALSNDLLSVSLKNAGSDSAYLEITAATEVSGSSTITLEFLGQRIVLDTTITKVE